MNPKQLEMDTIEEVVLQAVFGADWRGSKLFLLLNAYKPNLVQNYINRFESIVEPFMSESGTINGYLLRNALQGKHPTLAELIPDREFRLTDVAGEIIALIRG